jgi:5-methylthioadenosine/S-adenosylhomocysteine deaminase
MRRLFTASLCAVVAIGACADQSNPTGPTGPIGDADGGPDGTVVDTDGGAPSTVTGDPHNGILLLGTVIGESGAFDGEVLIATDGTIACAEPGTACEADPRAGLAARSSVGIIAPGLIDTHNHILFDIFDDSDWAPSTTYQNHNDWTKASNEPRYPVMVDVKQCLEDASQGKPTWCPTTYDGTGTLRCEMEKWGELKGVVAGTTSIVGLTGTAYPCYASLARLIDTQFAGLPADKVQTSALFPPSKTSADGVCNNFASGKTDAYLIHCGEGIDAAALNEFSTLGTVSTTPQCLYHPKTAITHGTAFTATEFAIMKNADMKLTWSPASNVALYGKTTDIPAALDAGLTISLAPDWSMGGSQNLLQELKFAKKWSDDHWAGRLSAQDLVTMVTVNAAKVLNLQTTIGTIKAGYLADIMVVRGDKSKPYDAIVAATPADVQLTLVGGKPLYGDDTLRNFSLVAPTCEDFDACGAKKFLCVVEPGQTTNKLDQTYAQIKATLENAMLDMDAVRPPGGNPFAPVAPVVACK